MLRFSLFGIPIAVEWWFWLITVLLGQGLSAQTPEDWTRVAIWTAVVFVSIVLHELGHALVGRCFGAEPTIRLHGFGGSTFLPGTSFRRGQSILVSATGPLAGFAAGLAVWGLNSVIDAESLWLRLAIRHALYVNFFWTLINLLPIQPLDGGQILREILGPRMTRLTAWIGFILAGTLCLWTFSLGDYFPSLMLAMLAYYNFRQEPIAGGVIKQ